MIGYRNTMMYLVAGVALNMVMTSLAAYALSRKRYIFKTFFYIHNTFHNVFQWWVDSVLFVDQGSGYVGPGSFP